MSIYRRLNPRLLVQAGLGLDLLHWANMSNIYISNSLLEKTEFFQQWQKNKNKKIEREREEVERAVRE